MTDEPVLKHDHWGAKGNKLEGMDWVFGVGKMQTIAFRMDEQWGPAVQVQLSCFMDLKN